MSRMASTPDWLVLLRGLLLLGLGGAGMVHQMFFARSLDPARVSLSIAMILGEGVLSTLWLTGKSPNGGSRSSPPSPSSPLPQSGSSAGEA